MKYKKSKYNIIANSPQVQTDDVVIYNTWQCKFITLTREQYEFLQSKDLFEKNELPQQLITDKFVVLEALDETSTMLKQKRQNRWASKEYIHIEVCPTMLCNMNCAYCFEKEAVKQHMTEETERDFIDFVKRTVNEHSQLQIYHITWFGGEPTLNIDAIKRISKELISFFNEKNIIYRADMITNGFLLTKDVSEMLYDECQVEKVQITLDGFKETYAHIRNVDESTFDTVLDNIETAKQKVYLRLNVSNTNADEQLKLAHYMKERFGDKVVISYKKLRAFDEQTKLMAPNWEEFEPFRTIYIDTFYEDAKLYIPNPTKYDKCADCDFCIKDNIIVGSDGFIYRCDAHINIQHKAIGILKEGIDERNEIYEDFLNLTEFENDTTCRDCAYSPYCLSGCYEEFKRGVRPCGQYKYLVNKSIEKYLQQLQ